MIPYILAAVGGYFIGEATKKKANPLDNPWNILEKGGETKMLRGGRIEYAVEVKAKEKGVDDFYRFVYDIEADSESEAIDKAKNKFREDHEMDDLGISQIKVMRESEIMAEGGEVFLKNPVFTFKTEEEYENAKRSGYIDEYDVVRVMKVHPLGRSVDYPIHSEEEYEKLKKNKDESNLVKLSYQDKHYYDIMDYYDEPDYDEYEYDYPEDEDYAKGGKIKKSKIKKKRTRFVDKVSSISKRLEGQKVPASLRKDYGAKYDKKEAEEAARRIAGSQLKKLKE